MYESSRSFSRFHLRLVASPFLMAAVSLEGRVEPVNGKLIDSPKKSKLSKVSDRRISVSVKTLEAEQTPAAKAEALRLFCRALIRLYLKDHASNPENGKGLGIL
jgi:hypothetical protein